MGIRWLVGGTWSFGREGAATLGVLGGFSGSGGLSGYTEGGVTVEGVKRCELCVLGGNL